MYNLFLFFLHKYSHELINPSLCSMMMIRWHEARKKNKYPGQHVGRGMNIISLYMHNVPRYTLYKMSRSFR